MAGGARAKHVHNPLGDPRKLLVMGWGRCPVCEEVLMWVSCRHASRDHLRRGQEPRRGILAIPTRWSQRGLAIAQPPPNNPVAGLEETQGETIVGNSAPRPEFASPPSTQAVPNCWPKAFSLAQQASRPCFQLGNVVRFGSARDPGTGSPV